MSQDNPAIEEHSYLKQDTRGPGKGRQVREKHSRGRWQNSDGHGSSEEQRYKTPEKENSVNRPAA